MQVVAEGLKHPLVPWSLIALGVFSTRSPVWLMISPKKKILNPAPAPTTAVIFVSR